MNHQIMFTPNDVVSIILAVCGGIVTLSAAIAVIVKVIDKVKAPENVQNDRISKIEQRLNEFEEYLDRDKKRLDNLEFGNEATNEALLALLNNAINPSESKDELKAAKKKLEKYLISRRIDITNRGLEN